MYPRPPSSHAPKASDLSSSERPRSSWESSYQPSLRDFHRLAQRVVPTSDANSMDPESSDSDVSVGGGDEYRYASPLTAPIPLPSPPSKHALESSDAVQARLDELQRVEEHNIKKYDLLKAKRARKDDKIRRKREIQDKKWLAIVDARQRRDSRIQARRGREDAAFSLFFDQELEEEETSLRRRLKRLKRGLPPDESPKPGTAKISSVSISPPGSTLSTLPPPPKRHQVGPPGQADSVNPAQTRPSPQSNLAAPLKNTFSAAPYSFLRESGSGYPRPYHHSPYPTTPNAAASATTNNGLGNPSHPPSERSHLSHLGRPASPLTRPVPNLHSPATPATAANPPRQTSSSYDTRPPPTTTTAGFASVNAQPPSGFATINPRTTSASPLPPVGLARQPIVSEMNKTPSHQVLNGGMENTRFHSYAAPPGVSTPSTGPNKRTPSTTHPYQMSEAFANRHHHCERVDSLNRGIWTSYGVGGTKDNPTGPAVEMYLRCNHEGCSRIDWRTVHGLQCHIVKNHVQPKGTIGSLDKALEKYGVPVKEVQEYERVHGRGSAGTMADPKNHKIKIKTLEASGSPGYSGDRAPGSYVIDPETRPTGYRPSPTSTVSSPPGSEENKTSPTAATANGTPKTETPPDAGSRRSAAPVAPTGPAPAPAPISAPTFSSTSWLNSYMTPRKFEPEPKSLQGDFGMSETQGKNDPASGQAVALNGRFQTAPPPPTTKVESHQADSSAALSGNSSPKVPDAGSKLPLHVPSSPAAPPALPGTLPSAEPSTKDVEVGSTREIPQAGGNSSEPTPDEDVHMSGTAEQNAQSDQDSKTNGQTAGEETDKPDNDVPEGAAPGEYSSDHSETIVVDNDAGQQDATSKQKATQSPSMTSKTIPVTTPSSGRRPSRRLSTARPSADGDGDAGYAKEPRTATNMEGGKDHKEVKEEKDGGKPETRRSFNVRVLRRGRV